MRTCIASRAAIKKIRLWRNASARISFLPDNPDGQLAVVSVLGPDVILYADGHQEYKVVDTRRRACNPAPMSQTEAVLSLLSTVKPQLTRCEIRTRAMDDRPVIWHGRCSGCDRVSYSCKCWIPKVDRDEKAAREASDLLMGLIKTALEWRDFHTFCEEGMAADA